MNLKAIIFLLSISAFFVSCEDIVEVKLSDKDIGLYAVEAKITTDNNPYVLLYKSQLVTSNAEYPGVSGADSCYFKQFETKQKHRVAGKYRKTRTLLTEARNILLG